jgi:hypothetical protein
MLAIAEETPSTGRHQEDDAASNEVRGRQLSLLNAAEPPQFDAVSFTTEAMIHSEMPRVSEDIRLPALLTKNPKETLGADLDMISVVETEPVPHERENWNLPTPDEDPEQPTAETPTTTGRRLSTNSLTRSGTLPDLTSLIPEEPRQTTTTLTEFLIGIIRLGRSLGTEGDREIIHLAEAGLKLSDRELLQYVEEWIKRVIPKGSRRGKGKGMGAPAKNYGQKTTGRGPRAAAFKKAQRTVRRRLKEVELGSYVPAKVPKLEVRPRVARLAFGREHENWNIDQWSQVLFTDESRFCVNTIYGRERIWRRRGERYSQCNFTPKVPFGGGSIMIWGGIGLGARTELVIVDMGTLNADRYITNFLQDHVVPFAPHIGDNFILMQDNARPHIARCVTNFITETEITKMDWPARSPDMNPIEHVWDMLGKRVKARIPAPQTTQALQTMLLEEWDNLPQELIDNSIRSMPRRMIALIRARGGNTRY